MDTSNSDQLLTTAQAAKLLQVSAATLREWVRSGRVRAVRHGRGYRFERSALVRVEEPQKCHSTGVKVRRFGGRTSVSLDDPGFESQLEQLIVKKRKPSTTSSAPRRGLDRRDQACV